MLFFFLNLIIQQCAVQQTHAAFPSISSMLFFFQFCMTFNWKSCKTFDCKWFCARGGSRGGECWGWWWLSWGGRQDWENERCWKKRAGRSGGTGSRQLTVPLCPAAFYGCVMVCTVSARLCVFLCMCMCMCVRACLDRLYNLRDICCWTCVCVSTMCSSSFPLVKVNVIITEVLMSPDCRSAAAPHPPPPLLRPQLSNWDHVLLLQSSTSSPFPSPVPINCPEE